MTEPSSEQHPAGVTCILAAGGAAPDALELDQIEAFRAHMARRGEIKHTYTARLKDMSPSDPCYAALFDERAAKLRELDEEFDRNWPRSDDA